MKRANGDGSIIFLGKNRKRPYAVRLTVGWENGKQQYYYAGYGRTKKEAKEILAKSVLAPPDVRENYTFQEIFEEWRESYYKRKLSDSTKETYDMAFKHWEPLYDVKIKNLKTRQMQNVLDDMNQNGCSSSSVKKAKTIANLIFKYAESEDIVGKNYAYFLRPEGKPTAESEVFPVDDILTLFDNIDHPNVDAILILFFTGFRISEFCALRKENVHIEQGYIIGGGKTEAGTDRVIPILFLIQDLVRRRYELCDKFLIEGVRGHQVTSNHFRNKIYKPTLESLGVEYRSPHKARHTCATIMNECGVNETVISKIIGHTNIKFTNKTYVHLRIKRLQAEMEKVTMKNIADLKE